MKTALCLSYFGAQYHGWQRQKNACSVQQTLEEAIARACGEKVTLSGCGRTDAGVHARRYVASAPAFGKIPLARLPAALNAQLPYDISVQRALAMPDWFDARFSCRRKEYTYVILNRPARDPFYFQRALHHPWPLDIGAMQAAARHFCGRQDFAAVRSMGTPVKSTVREIYYCRVQRQDGLVRIRVCADGFLYNMVRAITGTLLYVGSGKIPPDAVLDILKSADREQAGPTAPAHGLYLTKLVYDNKELDEDEDQVLPFEK